MENKLTVTSPAFEDEAVIPIRYTGQGEDISPELRLSTIDERANSLAIIMNDMVHRMKPILNIAVIILTLSLAACNANPEGSSPIPEDSPLSAAISERSAAAPETSYPTPEGDRDTFKNALLDPDTSQHPKALGDAFLESYNILAPEYGAAPLATDAYTAFNEKQGGTGRLLNEGMNECTHMQIGKLPSGLAFNLYVEYRKVEFFGTPENLDAAKAEISTTLAAFCPDIPAADIREQADLWLAEGPTRDNPRSVSISEQGVLFLLYYSGDYLTFTAVDLLAVQAAWPEKTTLLKALQGYDWNQHIDYIGCSLSIADLDLDGTPELVAAVRSPIITSSNDYSKQSLVLKQQDGVFVAYATLPCDAFGNELPFFDGSSPRRGTPYYLNAVGSPVMLKTITPHHNHVDATFTMEISLVDFTARILFLRQDEYYTEAGELPTGYFFHDNRNYPFEFEMLDTNTDTEHRKEQGFIPLSAEQYRAQYLDYLKGVSEAGVIPRIQLFSYDGSLVDGQKWTDLQGNDLSENDANNLIAALLFLPCAIADL